SREPVLPGLPASYGNAPREATGFSAGRGREMPLRRIGVLPVGFGNRGGPVPKACSGGELFFLPPFRKRSEITLFLPAIIRPRWSGTPRGEGKPRSAQCKTA